MINPQLIKLVADARIEDLRRDAAQAALRREARAHHVLGGEGPDASITIRPALPGDARALAGLADLDSAPVPAGTLLVAEADGQLRAALSISDGAAIADPFHPTAATLQLLAARAAQLRGRPRRRIRVAWPPRRRWRAAFSRST
jgi:hypothetical protein